LSPTSGIKQGFLKVESGFKLSTRFSPEIIVLEQVE